MSAALEAVWGDVAERLRAALRASGLPATDVDDVVQEVALRVLDRDVAFESAEDLLRWCRVVGRHLAVDEHRRRRRAAPVGDLPEVVAAIDVEAAALARVRARQVARGVRLLTPTDRAALLAVAGEGADRREQVRLAVRRHRARARLAAIVDGVAALLTWVVLRRHRPSPGLAALAMAPALTGILLLPSQQQPTIELRSPARGGPGLVTATLASPPATAPTVAGAHPAATAGDREPDDDGDRRRRRPFRGAVRRLRDGEPDATIVLRLPGPAALPEQVPDVRIERARGIAPDLDVEVAGLLLTVR